MLTVAICFLGGLTVLYGYLVPSSIPGRFIHGTLDMFGLAGARYKERNALANYHASIDRKAKVVQAGAVVGGGQSEATLGSLQRERDAVMEDIATYNGRLDVLDADGLPDDDPKKVEVASDLMEAEARLKSISEDIERLQSSRKNITQRLREGAKEVDRGRRDARRLESQLKTSEVERDLAMLDSNLGGPDGHDTESQARELIQARIDSNRGSANALREVMGQGSETEALDRRVRDHKATAFLEARRQAKSTTPLGN